MLKRVSIHDCDGPPYDCTYDTRGTDVDLRGVRFNIKTYGNYVNGGSNKGYDTWYHNDIVKDFTDTLSKEDKEVILMMVLACHTDMLNVRTNQITITKCVNNMAVIVDEAFSQVGIAKRVIDFVLSSDKVNKKYDPSFGNREQDSKATTITVDEIMELNAIAILAKLLLPIFGEIIHLVQTKTNRANSSQEYFPYGIINKYIEREFESTMAKLTNYIHSTVSKRCKIDDWSAFKGNSVFVDATRKLAGSVIKNFVNIDTYNPNGNIVTNIYSTIRKVPGNRSDSLDKRNVNKRRDPDETSEEGSNKSELETALAVSNEPIFLKPFVRNGIDAFINNWLKSNNIDRAVLDDMTFFYKRNRIIPNSFIMTFVGLFIEAELGCAYSSVYCDMRLMNEVVCIIQLWARSNKLYNLLILMSSNKTDHPRESDMVTNIIAFQKSGETYKRAITQSLSHLTKVIDVREILDDLGRSIHEREFVFNLPIDFIENQESYYNEDGFVRYTNEVLEEVFGTIYKFMTNKDRSLSVPIDL